MSKKDKAPQMSGSEATSKRLELAKELVKFRVSMDTQAITTPGGLAGLRRTLRSVSRTAAIQSSQKK